MISDFKEADGGVVSIDDQWEQVLWAANQSLSYMDKKVEWYETIVCYRQKHVLNTSIDFEPL